jgi:diguanylate cyclase (GGDEF)-like protein/PAS domain S-box-containing protein
VTSSRRSSHPPEPAVDGPDTVFGQAIVDQLHEGVYLVDPARRIKYWNKGAEALTGYEASDVVGLFCHDNLLNHVDASGTSLCRTLCPLAATMRDGVSREADVFLRHHDGHRVPVQVRTTPVFDRDGKVIGGVEIFDDKTDLSAARSELSHLRDLAMTDALTQIPNRRHFEMTMASRIAEFAGYGRPFGLLIADLDRFKVLNDTYGHAAGDVALRTVARTMLEASRASDSVARIGGEEFGLTVANIDRAALRVVGERLGSLVARSRIRADPYDLGVTVSIGGSMAIPGDTAATIFKRADAALYRAKDGGRNRTEVDAP